jgi:hypothetical protein
LNHHYIPQFYLRPWLGDDHKLQEFRRGYQGRIQTGRYGTASTGCAEDLYTIPGVTDETKQNVEQYFMGLVDNAAVKTRDMLMNREMPKDPEIRHSWMRFLLSVLFRNPEELASFKGRFSTDLLSPDESIQAKYEAARQDSDPSRFEDWVVQNDPTYSERSAVIAMTKLVENVKTLDLLRSMHWRVLTTEKVSRKLMTSDRPVMMTMGMVQYRGHCAIPISPTQLFIAFSTVGFADEFSHVSAGRLARIVNETVIGQARKYVYSVDKSQFSEVKRRMGKLEPPSLIRSFVQRSKARA